MSMRESIFSIGSRMAQRLDDDIHFDVMSYEELQQMQDDLLQKVWMLTLENDVYERYLTRQDPQIMKTITRLLERSKYARRVTAHILPMSSRMSFRESIMSLHDFGKRSVTSASSVISALSESRLATSSMLTIRTQSESAKITIAHRITMANKEIDEMKKKLEDFKKSARKQKACMRAEIEELEIRISEVHEAKDDFEEEVVFKGVDPITGRIPAERIIRFIEEWLRSVNTIIERLRLKSATIKMQIKKAKQQLIQREELGEALHAVDFEQLNIQNKDYARMIEEKNRYVFEMKKIAGHYHLKLTQHKQKLSNLMLSLNEVKKEIALKQQQIEELKIEREEIEIDLKRRDERLKKLLFFMDRYKAPDILDFVRLMVELKELGKTYRLLDRRRNIEKIIFQSSQRHVRNNTNPDISHESVQNKKLISGTMFPIISYHKMSLPFI